MVNLHDDLHEPLEKDLHEPLKDAAKKHGHLKDGFDADGSGMRDGYVMFDIYKILLDHAGISFPPENCSIKNPALSGETLATFKANKVYDKLYEKWVPDTEEKPYEWWNKNCKRHPNPKVETLKDCKCKCTCQNPHYLGNFLPYPGHVEDKTHHTKEYNSISLQTTHNSCHNENPFKLLKDLQLLLEDSNHEPKTCWSVIVKNQFWKEYWHKFECFDKFVKAMFLDDFVKSDWFSGLKDDLKYPKDDPEYPDFFVHKKCKKKCKKKFNYEKYYNDTMKCIEERTKKMLGNPCIKAKLEAYLSCKGTKCSCKPFHEPSCEFSDQKS